MEFLDKQTNSDCFKTKKPLVEGFLLSLICNTYFLFELFDIGLEALVGIHQVIDSSAGMQYGCMIFSTTMHTNGSE